MLYYFTEFHVNPFSYFAISCSQIQMKKWISQLVVGYFIGLYSWPKKLWLIHPSKHRTSVNLSIHHICPCSKYSEWHVALLTACVLSLKKHYCPYVPEQESPNLPLNDGVSIMTHVKQHVTKLLGRCGSSPLAVGVPWRYTEARVCRFLWWCRFSRWCYHPWRYMLRLSARSGH